jgi:hypothetical protein
MEHHKPYVSERDEDMPEVAAMVMATIVKTDRK